MIQPLISGFLTGKAFSTNPSIEISEISESLEVKEDDPPAPSTSSDGLLESIESMEERALIQPPISDNTSGTSSSIKTSEISESLEVKEDDPPAPGTTSDGQLGSIESIEERESCSFRKGGYCNLHGTLGTKYWMKKKTWKKRRDGTFGYHHSRTVAYRCDETNSVEKAETIFPVTDGVVIEQKSNGFFS